MDDDPKKSLGRIALRRREVKASPPSRGSEDELKELSEKFGVPAVDLLQVCIRLDDLELLPREIARRHVILPLLVREDRLFVAMADPSDRKVVDELEFVTDKKVYPYVALAESLRTTIDEVYKTKATGAEFFVGEKCPPEVVAKAQAQRVSSIPPGSEPPSSTPGHREPRESLPPGEAGIVLDDLAERARGEEVSEDDFGDISEELSAVRDLPPVSETDPSAPTVLVVDDEDDIRTMLLRLFRSKGYKVLVAENGRTALRMVKEHMPDVIVLDAMLPEVHGFEIARRIKASQRYQHVPIVMVSAVYRGWRFAEDLKETWGIEHYIEKPFKIGEVLAAVQQALSKGGDKSGERDRAMNVEAESALQAGVTAYQEGRVEDAVAHLRRGVAIDPLAYRLHFHLGLLYGKQGNVYDAIAEIERAVDLNGRHYPALKNLAVLYQKAGFRNKATETWQRALIAAPDEPTRESIRQHLVSLI
jgi:DNA-binding response OmpR family regulator